MRWLEQHVAVGTGHLDVAAVKVVVEVDVLRLAARAADEALPAADIIFVTSTGFWEESGDPLAILDPTGKAGEPQKPGEPRAPSTADRTSRKGRKRAKHKHR